MAAAATTPPPKAAPATRQPRKAGCGTVTAPAGRTARQSTWGTTPALLTMWPAAAGGTAAATTAARGGSARAPLCAPCAGRGRRAGGTPARRPRLWRSSGAAAASRAAGRAATSARAGRRRRRRLGKTWTGRGLPRQPSLLVRVPTGGGGGHSVACVGACLEAASVPNGPLACLRSTHPAKRLYLCCHVHASPQLLSIALQHNHNLLNKPLPPSAFSLLPLQNEAAMTTTRMTSTSKRPSLRGLPCLG